jgi:hypothetical protein
MGGRQRRKELFRSDKQQLLEALRVCRNAVIDSHRRYFPAGPVTSEAAH